MVKSVSFSKPPFTLVVLISGNGSNLQAIIDAIKAQQLPITIRAVISDQAEAYGLQRAENANIPTLILKAKDYLNRGAYDDALLTHLKQYQPNLIVLSGFMRILGPTIVAAYAGKIINIHPSLLPKYPGLHTYRKALKAGDTEHGTTVHYVTDTLDAGPIIAQKRLSILPNDTEASLKQRTQALEHQLYPEVIAKIARGSRT